MPSTEDILKAARELGEKISQHDAAKKFQDIVTRLRDDQDAQRLLNDYNRHLQTVSEKEMNQQPIEVEDKARLKELQTKVVTHPVLRDLQIAQMDYVDLMRRVDEAMTGQTPDTPPAPGATPGATPGVMPGQAGL
ncbi:YlbF family regulator [Phycisphaerales bacterium AB-hyl4]|uniref:YlbF family regulator n=1 Tax=Natronomicrosphaera hydrolytica TaxID=3242702 RepID=A0ABV4U506_9BACT